jgi:mono/diheme cytochrome c family protein
MTRIAIAVAAFFLAGCQPAEPPTMVSAAAPAVAGDEQLVARGREVARLWCADCHRIDPAQRRVARARMNAPPFIDVANMQDQSAAALRQFSDELHLPMPTFRLWDDERNAVVAYIMSLRRAGPAGR